MSGSVDGGGADSGTGTGTASPVRAGAKYAVAGAAGATVLQSLMATTRLEPLNTEAYEVFFRKQQAVVFALWHGRLLPPTYRHRHTGIVTLASQSGDGEYITRMLHHWGFHVVRGSSSRGGDTALRELIRLVRGGRSVAITADGPRGPLHQMKLGLLQIAQVTGAPVVTVGSAASRAWQLKSWDSFLIPRPLSRVRIVYGEPVFIPRTLKGEALVAEARRLEAIMAELTREAEAPFG